MMTDIKDVTAVTEVTLIKYEALSGVAYDKKEDAIADSLCYVMGELISCGYGGTNESETIAAMLDNREKLNAILDAAEELRAKGYFK